MLTENSPTPDTGSGLSVPPPTTTASVEVWGSGYPKFRNDRGVPEICIGVREFECIGGVPSAGSPAHLHRYGRGGHDPVSLLRNAVPLRSSIDTARCRPARQFLC